MNLRDALVQQSPSLALQRAAADELSRLDYDISQMFEFLYQYDMIDEFNEWLARNTEE